MKIALLCGSPKPKESASQVLLQILKSHFSTDAEVVEIPVHTKVLPENAVAQLDRADAWVFSFPLYVDGIPSHLLSVLCKLESHPANAPERRVYGIVNCGFYEGVQAELALELLQHWCQKAGVIWSGGVGIGGGGAVSMLSGLKPGTGPRAPIDKAIKTFAAQIQNRAQTENCYVCVNMPRFVYKIAAQMGWRQMIRANGGKSKDRNNCPK